MTRALRSGPASASAVWPSVAMIAGGALNIAVWPVYTSVHGPGSVDMQGEVLGMGTLFWGSMMEGPSGLLIALGLAGSYGRLIGRAGRMARVGYVLTMIGVVIPAVVNLAILAVIPPLLAPVFGTGLILMAVANRRTSSLTRFSRLLLWGLGVVLFWSVLWLVAVRPYMLDQIDGYRIYGAVANVLFGLGWILFGASLIARGPITEAGRPIPAASPSN